MQVNYQYASPSMLVRQDDHITLGMSPDILRDEKVSFLGKLKNPLVFRDAMLMLREIIISDARQKKKERTEYFQWLNTEIERRMEKHEKNIPGIRESLLLDINNLTHKIAGKDAALSNLIAGRKKIGKEIDSYDAWGDYYRLERGFWSFLLRRDKDLWYVLDPVITVHPDQVSFEAFSVDESIYGCLSIDMDEFEMRAQPKLGTTNIDFSAKLAKEMERFRTYSDVELSVNPDGFTMETGVMPEYIEKKIDLPETWIKGFNQVSSAANLTGTLIELTPVDMYDICSFLRRHKAQKSPRYMKWILERDKPVKIVFEPFGKEITLQAVYQGEKNREEKIWGRRRWLVAEKLLPLAKSFTIKLLGFGMPQFIIADLGKMKMTIGFSSWSANDWVKGTAFNIMSGFIGEGNYSHVYSLLKEKRSMKIEDICNHFSSETKSTITSGIGSLLKRGEGYFDPVNGMVRFRRLCSTPIPQELYETTEAERQVQKHLADDMKDLRMKMSDKNEYIFMNKSDKKTETEIIIDEDGQISKVHCTCREFKKGPRNISAPCSHILALYVTSAKFTKLSLPQNKIYTINDIMEMVL